jgi:hypothetical protein
MVVIYKFKPAEITLITATKPDRVTKEFFLDSNGALCKTTTANVSTGMMETIKVRSLGDFSNILQNLSYNQCFAYGITGRDKVNLMTESDWAKNGYPDDAMSRSAKHMMWHQGPGILMLDYDPSKDEKTKTLTQEELIAALKNACPTLKEVNMLWWPSTSSNIFLGDKELSGIKGQRIYIMVKDASDIPRLGNVINTLLWAKGIGHFEVSKSGSLLERGLFDGSVWQTNRIDFAAGAKCSDGLEQCRGDPKLIPGKMKILDSLTAIPDPSPEEIAQAEANKAKSKAEKLEEAKMIRHKWSEARVDEIIKNNPNVNKEHAEDTVRRAVENQVLMGNWQISVLRKDNTIESFSVRHILDHSTEFQNLETLDPLEPDYDGGRPVGKLFFSGTRVCLHSFAHGGIKYILQKQPVSIEIVKGKIKETTDVTIDALRQSSDVFDFGPNLTIVGNNGRLMFLDQNSLSYILSGIIQFYRYKTTENGRERILVDPPASICNKILSLHGVRNLKRLVAIITAPTLRPDGSLLSSIGYDESTGLLLDMQELPLPIPENPTKKQAMAALERIWMPFSKFPFVTSLDRAVFLSALLTSVLRAGLDTAPGFGFDAPVQSSGKTLLGRCIAIIATGVEPGIIPHVASGSDEETRKRLFALVKSGDRVILLDNIVGTFDSVAMAALLTSETYSDRILGQSDVINVPNRALALFTGNNLTFSGDMSRRVLVCRIDPEVEQPYARKFDLNPAAHCLQHRQQIVADALTLIRFYQSSCSSPLGKGKMGSFENWDGLVRQTVLYIDQELKPGFFGDVMEAINKNQASDPEKECLGVLLQAWHSYFGEERQSLSHVIDSYRNVVNEKTGNPSSAINDLVKAIDDFLPDSKELSTKTFGKLLKYRKDQIVNGFRFEQSKNGKNASKWRVVKLEN